MEAYSYYHYYVEGKDEKKLIDTLKTKMQLICAGKVDVFNAAQKRLTPSRLSTLKKNTCVILVFDTDAGELAILNANIQMLKENMAVRKVACIPQVQNLEDELKRSCNIKEIRELTKSRSNKDFKTDLIKTNNLEDRLRICEFDFARFWNMTSKGEYQSISNDADIIRK